MRFYFYGAAFYRNAPQTASGLQAEFPTHAIRHKLLMIMKLTTIFILITCLHVSANGIGQKLSFTGKDVPVEQVFAAIEKQTGYVVFFDYASLGGIKQVSVSVKDASISELLRACFKDESVHFTIQGKTVLISRKETAEKVAENFAPAPPEEIKGYVVDSIGNPLVGASVVIKGTKRGVHTNDKGGFILKDAGDNVTLEVSFTGYQTQIWKVNKSGGNYIVLKASANPLDETIVQAYGTTTRRFNVGSIARVSREEIQSQPVFNVLSALEGRVAGLLVTTQSGIPGAAFKIQVRGQNTLGSTVVPAAQRVPDNPLFIIDGVPFGPQNASYTQLQSALTTSMNQSGGGVSPFNNINPADIESIEVLKDADATAIYGARGANGVILITTRKTSLGKAKLSGTVNAGFSRITRGMKMMSTEQYLQMRKEAFKNDNLTPSSNPGTSYAPDLTLFDQSKYTNFLQDWFGNTTSMYSANLFFSGGTAVNSFAISGGYDRQGNSFPGDFSNDRLSLSSRIHHSSIDRRFNIDLSTGYNYGRNNLPGSPNSGQGFSLPPNFPDIIGPNDSLIWMYKGTSFTSLLGSFTNPFAYLKQTSSVNTHMITVNANTSYRLAPGLTLKATAGYNLTLVNEYKKTPIASLDPYGFLPLVGNASKANTNIYAWNVEPQINYTRRLGAGGKLDVLAGMTFWKNMTSGLRVEGGNYPNDLLLSSINAARTIQTTETNVPYKYNALFGRINYVLKDRYIVNFTGRRDGSSRFIDSRKWGQFGAVGAGWIFSEEKFLKNKGLPVSYGKLRGSYGTTGLDNVGDYLYYSNWRPSGASYSYSGSGGLSPANLENPDFGWSTTRKLELGLELGLFSDRVLFGAAWYRNLSSNQLISYRLPSQTGFSNVTKNFEAEIENKGWEFTGSVDIIRKKTLSWKSSFNISIPKNKLHAFPGLASSSYGMQYSIGQSVATVYGYKTAGINDATGAYQFLSAKGDVVSSPSAFNGDNRFILGNGDPKYFGGWRNSFSYKSFQLELFVEFRKQWGPNFLQSILVTPGSLNNMPAELLDRWTGPGSNATYQRFTVLGNTPPAMAQNIMRMSDFAYGDASFIRFKTLSLSYSINPVFLKRIKMSSCNIFLNTQNLFVITGYKGHDPETQNLYGLPPLKTVSTGLQFNF